MTPDAARALADLRRVANACPEHAATIRAAGRTLMAALADANDLLASVAEILADEDEAPEPLANWGASFAFRPEYLAPVPASPSPAGEATPAPSGVNVTDHAADGVAPGRCEARKGGWRCHLDAGHAGVHVNTWGIAWPIFAVDSQEDDGDVCGVPV